MNEIEEILNETDVRIQYEKLIDYLYRTISEKYEMEKRCDFQCGTCIANRLGKSVHDCNGCCYTKGHVCSHLKNGACSIQSISCRLFFCSYLEKKYGKCHLSQFYPVKKVWNRKQRYFVEKSYFVDKKELVEKLLQLR